MLMSRIWFHMDMSSWCTWIKMDIAYSYNIDIHGFIWFCRNLKSWAHRWAAVLHYWWSCWRKDTYTYEEHAKSKAWNCVPYKNYDNLSSNVDGLDPLPPGRVSEKRVAVVRRKEGCAEACGNSDQVISALCLTNMTGKLTRVCTGFEPITLTLTAQDFNQHATIQPAK